MLSTTVLLLCLGPALGLPATLIPENLKDSMVGFINSSNSAAQLAARLAARHSTNATATMISANNNISSFMSTALRGLVDNFNQFLNACSRLFSGIPFIGSTVGIGNSALKTEAKLFNAVGQDVIQATQNVTNMNLRVLDQVAQSQLDAFKTASNFSADVISELARDDVEVLNERFRDSYADFDYIYNAIDEDYY